MSKPVFSLGLNLSKKAGPSKPAPGKRKPPSAFGGFGGDGNDSSDDDASGRGFPPAAAPKQKRKPGVGDKNDGSGTLGLTDEPVEEVSITEIDGLASPESEAKGKVGEDDKSRKQNLKSKPPAAPPSKPSTASRLAVGPDLSASLTSRQHAAAAEALDPSIYDYDAAWEKMKSAERERRRLQGEDEANGERRPRYMTNLHASAALRKRDALIAEEARMARERAEEEASGEFAGKEAFVTDAYRRQQEENRRLEEEEKRREEEERRGRQGGGGMVGFYRGLLEVEEKRHEEAVKAAQAAAAEKRRPDQKDGEGEKEEEADDDRDRIAAQMAREINARGGAVAINEDGLVVDKRQLLKGGLNIIASKKKTHQPGGGDASRGGGPGSAGSMPTSSTSVGADPGGKRAVRERQTRMLEAQLEARLKRAREEEEAERARLEAESKSRKTAADISSARERYLARKREAEEAKKAAAAAGTDA